MSQPRRRRDSSSTVGVAGARFDFPRGPSRIRDQHAALAVAALLRDDQRRQVRVAAFLLWARGALVENVGKVPDVVPLPLQDRVHEPEVQFALHLPEVPKARAVVGTELARLVSAD